MQTWVPGYPGTREHKDGKEVPVKAGKEEVKVVGARYPGTIGAANFQIAPFQHTRVPGDPSNSFQVPGIPGVLILSPQLVPCHIIEKRIPNVNRGIGKDLFFLITGRANR